MDLTFGFLRLSTLSCLSTLGLTTFGLLTDNSLFTFSLSALGDLLSAFSLTTLYYRLSAFGLLTTFNSLATFVYNLSAP